jgi:hypothetical protein
VHSIKALLEGTPLVVRWFDRTQEYAARQRGEELDRLDSATSYTVQLSPLPCWEHLSPEHQRDRVAEIARECDAESIARREQCHRYPYIPPLPDVNSPPLSRREVGDGS